jgi:hypothetical protein
MSLLNAGEAKGAMASMMCTRRVNRSSIEPFRRSLPRTSIHCSKGRLVVTMRLTRVKEPPESPVRPASCRSLLPGA